LRVSSWFDAVTFEGFDDGIRTEIIHAHAEVIDAGRTRRGLRGASTAATGEHEELNAGTDTHHGAPGS